MGLDRRDFLKLASAAGALGAAAGPSSVALAQGGRAPEPAAQGEIRVKDVIFHDTGRVIVQVLTDAGIDGWGEINTVPARMALGVAEAFKPLLIGINPTRIEHVWQMLYRAHRNVRGGLIHTSVIGGIDIALWDVLGKVAKLPVYTLLGGPCRRRIRHYPSGKAWKQTTQLLHAMVETPARLDGVVAALEKDRQRLGRDGCLMLDGHGKLTAQAAIQLCRRIEQFDLLYFEEVVPPENNADLLRVKRATTVPLAAGERMSTLWAFRPLLEAQAVDVLNPDVVQVGGISQLRKIAAVAELYDVPIAPHSTHSPIGLTASLHVDAAVNNFLIQEAYRHTTDVPWIAGLDWPKDATALPLPAGPGLGITVDLDGLADAVAKAKSAPARGVGKAYFLSDGSVADR